jgi:hypothetical protein
MTVGYDSLYAAGSRGDTAIQRPDVLIFVHDDQNVWDTPGNATPAAKLLAEAGIIFTNARATAAICVPSRASLLTGLYPMRHGAIANHYLVRPTAPNVASLLRPLGYRVHIIGKAHHGIGYGMPFDTVRATTGEIDLGLVNATLISDRLHPFCLLMMSHRPHPPWANKTGDKGARSSLATMRPAEVPRCVQSRKPFNYYITCANGSTSRSPRCSSNNDDDDARRRHYDDTNDTYSTPSNMLLQAPAAAAAYSAAVREGDDELRSVLALIEFHNRTTNCLVVCRAHVSHSACLI